MKTSSKMRSARVLVATLIGLASVGAGANLAVGVELPQGATTALAQGKCTKSTCWYATAPLVMRSSPGSWNYKLRTIPKGSYITRTGGTDYTYDSKCGDYAWVTVSYNGTHGWVCSRYIK